jgi:hypothetical protein
VVYVAMAKEHGFSVEMKSKEYVRRVSVSDDPRNAVIFEGFLGEIDEIGMVEEVILEIRAANGTLRIGLSEEELTGLDPEFSLKGKRDKILELRIDVYFEDEPRNVGRLREMLPGVAIIQYGGILESEHSPTLGA